MFMKPNFTFDFKTLLLSFLLLLTVTLKAQFTGQNFVRDSVLSLPLPVTDHKIVQATITFNKLTETAGKINAGIALSQDTAKAWGDYSTYIRFDNADAGTKGIIQSRNEGASPNMVAEDTLYFDFDKIYYLWFDIDFANNKYTAKVQEATSSEISTIGTNLNFRKKPVSALGFINALHNGQNGDTIRLVISDVKFVDAIGELSDDATLSELKVNGETITGFSPDNITYTIKLPAGTSIVPVISATTNETNAEIEISQATSVNGSATIVVTAPDGKTIKTYSVNFNVATKINSYKLSIVKVYPTITSDQVKIVSSSDIQIIKAYDIQGKIYVNKLIQSTQAVMNVSVWESGIYFINVVTNEGSGQYKIIVTK
jgi:hypothetical protein